MVFFCKYEICILKVEMTPREFERLLNASFRRITPKQACEETRTRLESPDLTVWVFRDGAWTALSRAQTSRLWAADDKTRSLCYLLFRDVLRMSDDAYAKFRRKMELPGLTGVYKGSRGQYAIVVQPAEPNRHAIKAAVAAGVIAAGAIAYNQRYRWNPKTHASKVKQPPTVDTPSFAKLPFFSKPSPKGLMGPLLYLKKFPVANYDELVCLDVGMQSGTPNVVLAFYYFKILPEIRRNDVFLCNGVIMYKPYEIIPRIENAKGYIRMRRDFHSAVNSFLSAVPSSAKMGICLMSTGDHATMLVFDVAEHRLEFYDPNGRTATYHGNVGDQTRTPYAYFARNSRKLSAMNPKLCKIWAPEFQFQHEPASCAMWSTGIAICRMSGIARDRLSTSIQDMKLISQAIRKSLFDTCQFSSFAQSTPYNPDEVDRALEACKVPDIDCERVTDLVRNCERPTPMPIPDDVDVCESQLQSGKPIDCDDVHIDQYESDIDVETLQNKCAHIGSITFRGNPTQFPSKLYSSTDSVTFQPRSKFVSLNFDVKDMVSGMTNNKNVRVRIEVGFVDLSKGSIIDGAEWDLIKLQLTIDRTLVVGNLPANYKELLERLSQISTPYAYISAAERDPRKFQDPFTHIVTFEKAVNDSVNVPGLQIYNLQEFERGA